MQEIKRLKKERKERKKERESDACIKRLTPKAYIPNRCVNYTGCVLRCNRVISVLSSFINAFAGTSAVVTSGYNATGTTLNGSSTTTTGLTSRLNSVPTTLL
jgi:hypothetical protein